MWYRVYLIYLIIENMENHVFLNLFIMHRKFL